MPVASPTSVKVTMEPINDLVLEQKGQQQSQKASATVLPTVVNNTTQSTMDQSIESISKEEMKYKKLMMKGFIQGALRDYSQGNAAKYNELIGQLTKKHQQVDAPSTVQLYVWVITLSECVSQLDRNCHELVVAILQLDWSVRSSSFVDAYIGFMRNLVSAHSFYVVPALNCIVEGFRYRYQLPPYSTTTRSVAYSRHHQALQAILDLIPTASNSLYVSIQRSIPFKQRSTADQAAYVKNIIEVMDYVPVLRKQIMSLLVDHLVKIDSHIQIELDDLDEDVEFGTYNMNFDEDYHSDNSDSDDDDNDDDDSGDDLDNVESEVDSDFGDDDDEDNKNQSTSQSKQMRQVRSMVRRLDSLMQLIFTHFAACAKTNSPVTLTTSFNNNNNMTRYSTMDLRSEMYHILLETFDRSVLKTLKSRYTQFLLFYFCSLDQHYTDHFLDHLFQHLTDPLRPNVTRIAAAAYISSYVARAKFMMAPTIQRAMSTLCHWCETLLDQHEATISLNNMNNMNSTDKYEVFYASMQAIMYIFCFRWRDLILRDEDGLDTFNNNDSDDDDLIMEGINDHKVTQSTIASSEELQSLDGKKWCHGLRNMPRLLMNRFHPLKVCSPPVVRQFAKVAHQSHFMYIYPLLERNKDLMVPGTNVNAISATGAKNLLRTVQTFFPFDPYKLEGSRKFIEGIYFEWIPTEDDDDSSDDDDNNSDSEDEDDMSAGMTAMSISPSPAQFL
ncbi:RNA polymerase I-specific transcription initiation factor RRN3 [Halteromyces radiatus]|uniref:RNA polymerase I-specific transcription initiation factor RRN3 n=1 Tax=Halteromyces radiatus TaxID=101107 RepID=UPI00221FB65D|nr:RNA polymerase I-specific transcription initiation factor RRN3 [Halteromyces radiatus]KAI8096959.1 RNA polymerase I-specific transcription initiation factor RRN3 [Halteromyces radiatus]